MALRLGVLAVVAALVVVLAVVLGSPAGEARRSDTRSGAVTAAEIAALRGVPQDGIALGAPDAPVTMVEFGDLQCPFCREYHEQAFPTLLERYVKSGKLRLELRLLRFVGPDSDRLARTAAGAAGEDRMWQVAGLAYARQGVENSGYADQDFLDALVADAGLDRVDAGRDAELLVGSAEKSAHHADIDSTPSFLIGRTGGTLTRFQPDALASALIMLCIAGLATVRALKLARASQSLRPESASMQTTIARTRPSSSPGATSTP
jgi:protein-disulfide isomerase